MSKKMSLKVVSLCVALGFSGIVNAGGYLGEVGWIYVQQPSHVFVSLGGHNSPPFCQGGSDEFAVNIGTTLGRSQYALLLTAKSLGTKVQIVGTGGCELGFAREAINYIIMQ